MCARIARAIAARVPDTANGGGRCVAAAFGAESYILPAVAGASVLCSRMASEDSLAPVFAVCGCAENAANATQAEEAADRHRDNGSKGVPPRGRAGQRLGELVKSR